MMLSKISKLSLFLNLSMMFSMTMAFTSNVLTARSIRSSAPMMLFASLEEEDTENEIPCLPPIGYSSFDGETSASGETIRLDGTSCDVNHVGTEKFELQYTCKVCETRNSHRVSRMAYRNGVVITVCKGCMSKHLIADNLGWTKYSGGFVSDDINTIEDFFSSKGKADEVNRVSPEVFDLEKSLHESNHVFFETHRDEDAAFE